MNQDLINKAIARAKDGRINLGCANGWLNETNDIYRELRDHMVAGTATSENLGRCYNEYTFGVELNGSSYTVVYSVDSSD